MKKSEAISYLAEAIEEMIDAKINLADGGYKPLEQSRANVREALGILLDIEVK